MSELIHLFFEITISSIITDVVLLFLFVDLTSTLIQRKQFLEAARFSSLFGLSMKFLPESILSNYLQNTWMEILQSSKGNNSFVEQVYEFILHFLFFVLK